MARTPSQTKQFSSKKSRLMFTKDAKFTLQRFAANATAADGGVTAPPKPGVIATISGYAILWNTLSDDRGGYRVRLLPKSAKFADPTMALFHHNFAAILGNTQNGTLRITPDDIGVKVEIDVPQTTTGNDVVELVDKRYVQGMSFCMTNAPDFEMVTENDQQIMNVSAFSCDEVTVTAIPSFSDSSIGVAQDNRPEPATDASMAASADEDGSNDGDGDADEMAAAQKHSKDATPIRNVQKLKSQKYKLDQLTL